MNTEISTDAPISTMSSESLIKNIAIIGACVLGPAATGASLGAVIGTFVLPGVGTAIGAVIGALFGAGAGLVVAGWQELFRKQNPELQPMPERVAAGIASTIGAAGIGALLGTFVFPGIGTLIGALIGAGIGILLTGSIGLGTHPKQSNMAKSTIDAGYNGAYDAFRNAGLTAMDEKQKPHDNTSSQRQPPKAAYSLHTQALPKNETGLLSLSPRSW